MYNAIYDSLIIAKKVIYLPSCHSTNDIAAELVRDQSFPEGTVVITDEQTKGKGQRGSIWVTKPGQNLTFSIVLRPNFLLVSEQFMISKAIAVGVCSYLTSYSTTAKIKWPNDVYLNDRKICGTLIENSIQGGKISGSVAGIGVNINQNDFGTVRATSLSVHQDRPFLLAEEFAKLGSHIDAAYLKLKSTTGRNYIDSEYLKFLYGYQTVREFKVNDQILSGEITGVTSSGKLCIRFGSEKNPVEFGNKEVEWVWE